MSASLLLWGLLAVTVFWCVGLYNRLMRIRARAVDALGSVEKQIKAYGACIRVHVRAVRGAENTAADVILGSMPFPARWADLQDAAEAAEAACKAARHAPSVESCMDTLRQKLDEVWRIWALLKDAPADLAGSTVPEGLLVEWEDITNKVLSARGGFNQIVVRYNEAIEQFPARLVARTMGFKPTLTL